MQFCNGMAKLHEFYAFQYCPWVKVMTPFPYLHSDTSADMDRYNKKLAIQ